ncbi:ATP-binding cassette domain-containing protein [Granulicella sp. 5B5]|uniref:ATP-binding cassette domain-containing protein n=1 Tax=Granulicella sp. 5B5 TaxID=1617967 RepID=UPI0015F420CB|nr:ABC transporter ATP-binding protein [Granulicella sp. 5B5]QMV20011.1 ATP-binding cassette domain-containing protein [Granulicella sp. 5B5]
MLTLFDRPPFAVLAPTASSRRRSAYLLLSKQQRLLYILLIAARVSVGLLDLLLAGSLYLLFLVLQGIVPNNQLWWQPQSVLQVSLVAGSLVVIRSLADALSTGSLLNFVQNIYKDLLQRLTQGYSEVRWETFVQLNRSDLLNHTTYTAREASQFYLRGIELMSAQIVVLVMAVAVVAKSPTGAVGLACTLASFYALHRFFIRDRVHIAAAIREQSFGALQCVLSDMFSSGKEIRIYRNHSFFQAQIREHADAVSTESVRLSLLPQLARILSDQGVLLIFLGLLVAVQLQQGDVRRLLAIIVFYFVLSRRMLPLTSQISFLAGQIDGSYENVRLVSAELDGCSRQRNTQVQCGSPGPDTVLELEDVSFGFEEEVQILRNISFRQRHGETVILHGVSGSGKSSLLNIIAGLLQPTGGAVRVDRTRIAYVPQDTVLLDASMRTNLLFGLEGKSDKDLMRALTLAQLDTFLSAQPDGLDTRVGDNGILFSGGQRQRLGIARALVRGGTLLLLDEATSALDEENELQVLKNLEEEGLAVLLVTHRKYVRFSAQRVFNLEGCRLVEQMSPQAETPEPSSETILNMV